MLAPSNNQNWKIASLNIIIEPSLNWKMKASPGIIFNWAEPSIKIHIIKAKLNFYNRLQKKTIRVVKYKRAKNGTIEVTKNNLRCHILIIGMKKGSLIRQVLSFKVMLASEGTLAIPSNDLFTIYSDKLDLLNRDIKIHLFFFQLENFFLMVSPLETPEVSLDLPKGR